MLTYKIQQKVGENYITLKDHQGYDMEAITLSNAWYIIYLFRMREQTAVECRIVTSKGEYIY